MKFRSLWKLPIAFTFLVVVFVGCDQFGLYEEFESESAESQAAALSIAPSAATLTANASLTFAATGGAPPYSYSITSGGSSGTIDADTGMYSAPPGAGTDTVRVTDSAGETNDAEVTVTAAGALGISPPSVSLVTNGTITFTATGGTGPYTFSVVSGDGSIDTDSGAYTAPPTSGSATVQVTDSATPSAQADATATVYEPLRIVPESTSLSEGSSFDFSATGGKTPYTFTVASGGGSIDSATGMYSATGGPGNVEVRVTDDLGNTREAAVTVTAVQPLVISPSSPTLTVGTSLTFTATGGTSPYTFSILAPADGSIDSATGEYAAPGSAATDTVRVTDALGNTSDATATVVVSGPLSISPDVATVPVNGQREFSASGGDPPYSFAVVTGPGSINASTGVYSAPASTGTVTVRVTDSSLNSDDAAVTVAGAGCGMSFSESEPNDDADTPWTDVDDFGIVLVPGCSVTITGVTDTDGDSDVFKFDRGSANDVTFLAEWTTGDDELEFQLYDQGGNGISDSDSDDADREFMMWTVDGGSPLRYLELEVAGDGGVSYTLTISAD